MALGYFDEIRSRENDLLVVPLIGYRFGMECHKAFRYEWLPLAPILP
jgi:hypothetical protein